MYHNGIFLLLDTLNDESALAIVFNLSVEKMANPAVDYPTIKLCLAVSIFPVLVENRTRPYFLISFMPFPFLPVFCPAGRDVD